MNMDTTATAEPIATEAPSGSAPATAEPSQSATTETAKPARIGSMRESFERLEKKQAASPDAGKTGTATTAQPASGEKAAAAPAGPIPLEVHQKALENARAKASTEAIAQYREKYGWAEKIPEQQLKQWGSMANRIATDPIGYVSDLLKEIEAHPVHGPAWKARNGAAQPAAAAASLDPDVQIVDDKGQPVGKTFSAERVQAIVKQAVDEALGREVQPLKTEYANRQAETEKQRRADLEKQQTEAAHKSADSILAEIEKILDGDKSLFDEVDKTMAQNPGMSAHSAALKVREDKIVPKLKGAATQDAITEMQRKANGNTANGNGRTAMPKKPTNPRELAAWMRDREAAATKA